jgi:hypothetical protein
MSKHSVSRQAGTSLVLTLGAKIVVTFFANIAFRGYSLNGFAKWTAQALSPQEGYRRGADESPPQTRQRFEVVVRSQPVGKVLLSSASAISIP